VEVRELFRSGSYAVLKFFPFYFKNFNTFAGVSLDKNLWSSRERRQVNKFINNPMFERFLREAQRELKKIRRISR